MVNRDSYPMYFTIKDKIIEKVSETQYLSHRDVGLALLQPVKVGETILFNKVEHEVLECSEPRPCKGNHKIDGVLFQQVKTKFFDNF